MSTKYDRPKEIIEFCLRPLNLEPASPQYQAVYERLEHVIRTYQVQVMKAKQPVTVDFSQMKTITLNEDAHGHD